MWIAIGLASLALAQPAAERQPDVAAALAAQTLPIAEINPGSYGGAGWDRLIGDGANAHFFMMGEQHMTADIARFGIAAHKALAGRGYSHAAYEIGPYSTDFAEKLIRSGKGKLADYIRAPGHGLVFPFLFFQEEVDLAEQIVAASPDTGNALWGLDQEFAASAPLAADLLREWATNEAERTAAQAFRAKVADAPGMIADKTWTEFADVERAFANNARAARYLGELKLSNQIYAPFTGRGGTGYEANLLRETYMKRNFQRRFEEAERRTGTAPRVFMKLGGNHAQKGFTGTDVPGLGNFLYEWGLSRGLSFVNIMVECVGGEALNPQTSEPMPCQPYFTKGSAIGAAVTSDKMTLIDLRPLRSGLSRWTDLDPASRSLILSFDYFLAIRDVKPATPTVRPTQ